MLKLLNQKLAEYQIEDLYNPLVQKGYKSLSLVAEMEDSEVPTVAVLAPHQRQLRKLIQACKDIGILNTSLF